MPRLFLLDGTALAFRSHYAMARSGLTAPDGSPTGATYGFTSTLRRILEQESPEYVAVALDAKGKTFRHEQYADYKATREKAPEELVQQIPLVREVVQAHGIPLFEVPGYEADDVLGTLARKASAAGWEVYLVTGDKDFMQLVDERTRLYNIFKQNEELVLEGAEAVQEKFGTGPEHVVDVLAIMGDSSDNVPGVKGIGEKGAIKLVSQYGDVDGVLAHLDELTPKLREKIEASRDLLLLSRELVTIDTDVPLDPPFEELPEPAPDVSAIADLFQRLDFRSMLDTLHHASEPQPEREDVLVRDAEGLEAMIAELREAGRFAFDTETTSLFPLEAELVGCSFSARAGRAFYVPFNLDPPVLPGGPQALLDALRPLLTEDRYFRVGQNYKYDALVLVHHGVRMPGPNFDTMVAGFCVLGSERRHDLDTLALHYFNQRKIPTTQLIGTGKKQVTMKEVAIDEVAEYACEDAEVTWRLYEVLEEELEATGNQALYHDLELPLVPVLAAMEERGIRLDEELLAEIGVEVERDAQQAALDVQEFAGMNFNVNSTKVLGEVLFERLRIQDEVGVKRPKRTKTGWATDAATLEEKYGELPVVRRVLEYRELSKLKSTYLDALPRYVNPETGRVHCSFSQVSAATGRLASSDPNLQNIPVRTARGRRLREAFVPREPDEAGEWRFLAADYSQIELRIMAHFSQDESMIEAFEQGHDIHAATAGRIFGVEPEDVTREMRSQAKVINFGLLYGMGPTRVARETGMSLTEAREFIDRYFGAFPRVREWIDGLLESARETGEVQTLLGRRRQLPEVRSGNQRVRAFAENAAVNTPIQGSAADVIKRAMIDVEQRLAESSLRGRMLLQVHDELLFEVPESELDETRELVVDTMENAVQLTVPLTVFVGTGANWLEAH